MSHSVDSEMIFKFPHHESPFLVSYCQHSGYRGTVDGGHKGVPLVIQHGAYYVPELEPMSSNCLGIYFFVVYRMPMKQSEVPKAT